MTQTVGPALGSTLYCRKERLSQTSGTLDWVVRTVTRRRSG